MIANNEIGIALDLDGVITATAKLHFKAWKKIANQYNMVLTKEQNDKLRGINRIKTAEAICQLNNRIFSKEELKLFCFKKNELYKKYLAKELNETYILANMKQTLHYLKHQGYKIVLTSSSRNAPIILAKLNLSNYFDAVVDPNTILNPKPYPDLYLKGINMIKIKPENAIGVEDAPAGIIGINNAKMISVAIQWTNHANQFLNPDYILKTSKELTPHFFEKVIKEKIRKYV